MKTIVATSWNGTIFTYNVVRDTWEMDVIANEEHSATEADMDNARECAEREKALFGEITLESTSA